MRHIPYTLLALVAAAGFASAQSTSYTTPVGYISVSAPVSADSPFSIPLNRPASIQTTAASGSGTSLTLNVGGLTVDQFTNKFFVQFNDGALAGRYFVISGNNASSGSTTVFTLEDSLGGSLIGTPSVSVIPFWTLNTLFPAGAGVGSSADPFVPESVVMFTDQVGTGINRATVGSYLYHAGSIDFPAGWYDSGNPFDGVKDDVVLIPDAMYIVRKESTAPATNIVISGEVPSVSPSNPFVVIASGENDNFVAQPLPVDLTLAQSGLFDAGNPLDCAIRSSDDPFVPGDQVLVFSDSPSTQNEATVASYLYHAGSIDFPAGWYDSGNPFGGLVTDAVLKAGRSFIIRKSAGTPSASNYWTTPLPYTLD